MSSDINTSEITYDYPLPQIKTDIERISTETPGSFSGSFFIRNTSGGTLSGKITSNSKCVVYSLKEFSGNKIKVDYTFNLDIYKKGDIIQTSALIMSNGGQVVIPIHIRITAPAIVCDETRIFSLSDFMFYTKKNPEAGRKLFYKPEFFEWLQNIGYPHMEMYEYFIGDTNKERAVDNFLVFNSLKKKAAITPLNSKINLKLKFKETDPITGVIPFKLDGWGYVDAAISLDSDMKWLQLMVSKIDQTDFDENGFFEASFIIYPSLITKKHEEAIVFLNDENLMPINIFVIRERPLDVKILKSSFSYADSGKILVKNETGGDVMLEITSVDPFIRLEGKRYFIGASAEIKFTIKFSAIAMAQNAIRKSPTLTSYINIKSVTEGVRFYKSIPVVIGNLVEG